MDETDTVLRMAAFEHVRRLREVHDHSAAIELKPGFVFAAAADTAKTVKSEIWLPFLDTYRTMCCAPEPALKRIFEGLRDLQPAA
jgi:hypothetical protein